MGWQIAIDGPAASGKSTVAKAIAKKLQFEYLDTGAMYRAVALKATRLGVNLEDEDSYKFLDSTSIDFIDSHIYLDGEDVSDKIRTQDMSNKASYVSKFGYVRKVLVAMQQKLASSKNIIMDGRDIGTVVLPNANLKIFLVADVTVRAERRYKERTSKNQTNMSLDEVIAELKARDLQDSTRENSPLKQAEDAVYLDTSKLSVNDVIKTITNLVFKRGYSMENLEQKNVNVEEKEEVKEETLEEVAEEVAAEITSEEETSEKQEAKKYKEMQLVKGVVVEVQEAQKARKVGQKEIKAKEERVLIELEDGQEGFLFRKDTAGIKDDEDLFDLFIEGDEVEVVIKKIFPDGGKFIFSTALIEKRNELIAFENTIKERPIITAKVIKQLAEVGLLMKYEDFTCLLPAQLTSIPKEEFESLIGKELEVVPIRVDLPRIRVIVSEIHAASKKQKAAKKEFLSKIEVGQVYEGVVKNIESYGAFVELGAGVEGLLHISEVDHNRISKIEKVLNTGDTVKVQVIKIEKDHIGLSRKALMPNHWVNYFEGKELGDVVTGKVVEINKAGIRVDLATEIEGFIPKSEFSWERDLVMEENVKVGDEINGKLIEIAQSKRRVILSVKQITENPWETVAVSEGEIIEVVIANVQEEGFKVSYKGLNGYMSKGTVRSRDPQTIEVGETIKVKVRVFNASKQRFIVSMRDAEEKVEKENFNKYIKSQDKMTNTFGDYLKK